VDEPDIVAISATESHIDGRLSIDDVNEQLNIALPTSDEYDSISGFVFSQLGREPLPGDRVRYENMEFIVEQVEGIYIRTLRALRLADLDADGNAAPAPADSDDGAPLVIGGAPTGAMTIISSATGDEVNGVPGQIRGNDGPNTAATDDDTPLSEQRRSAAR
jgi:hypothetical protein